MKEHRSRLLQARAGIKWLEYGHALGYLVYIDDVMPKVEEIMQVTKSRLYAMPVRLHQLLAAESDPEVVEEIVQKEIDDIFEHVDWMTKQIVQLPPGLGKQGVGDPAGDRQGSASTLSSHPQTHPRRRKELSGSFRLDLSA